jgi:RNA polymerase sigma factor (sigma-70 family)
MRGIVELGPRRDCHRMDGQGEVVGEKSDVKINRLRKANSNGLDSAAFVSLYDGYAEPLLRFFARRTLDAEVAFDLTAETFAEAFASRGRFDSSRGDAVAWLFGIAHHELGSYLRRLNVERRARKRLGIGERSLSEADHERIEAMIDFAAVGRQLRSALQTLPSEQREAVVYRVIDELSYEQIAERIGCSQDAARARVSRGLRLLGRTLTLPEEDPPGLGAEQ